MNAPVEGDLAPDFSLLGTEGEFTLSRHLGTPLCLAFYPGDFSPVCTMQLRDYSAHQDQFSLLGAQVIGISSQPRDLHEAFRASAGITVPLLSDLDQEVAARYGVLGPLGFYRRAVFVLDASHRIAYRHISRAGLSYQPSTALLAALGAAGAL